MERSYLRSRMYKAEQLCEKQRQDYECLESAHEIAKRSLDDDSARKLTNINRYLGEIDELQKQKETLKKIRIVRNERDENRNRDQQAVFEKFSVMIDRTQPVLNPSRLEGLCPRPEIRSDTLIIRLLTRIFGDCGVSRLKDYVHIMLERQATTVAVLHALFAAAVCIWALESPFYELTRAPGLLFDGYRMFIMEQGVFDPSERPRYSY